MLLLLGFSSLESAHRVIQSADLATYEFLSCRPVNLGNVGDFSFGNMEQIMAQIMEDHQPVNHPVSAELIANLPKR